MPSSPNNSIMKSVIRASIFGHRSDEAGYSVLSRSNTQVATWANSCAICAPVSAVGILPGAASTATTGSAPPRPRSSRKKSPARPPPAPDRLARNARPASSACDQRAGAVIGQQFHEHGMRRLAVKNDDTLDALLDCIDAGLDLRNHAAGDRAVGDQLADIVEPELLQDIAVLIEKPRHIRQQEQPLRA